MGYWSDYKPKHQSIDTWARNKYNYENENYKHEVLATGLVNRTQLYIAAKRTEKSDNIS